MSGTAYIWDMQDLKPPMTESSGQSYRSVLSPTEFSCRKQLRRVLSTRKMTDGMGEGVLVSEQTVVGPWVEVMPNTPDDQLMKAVCESQYTVAHFVEEMIFHERLPPHFADHTPCRLADVHHFRHRRQGSGQI